MVWSCTLLAILFIVRVSHGQLQECPSCCHHTFTKENITTAGTPQPFWDCNESEEFTIHVGRCFSECAYNVSVGMEFSYRRSYRVNYDLVIKIHALLTFNTSQSIITTYEIRYAVCCYCSFYSDLLYTLKLKVLHSEVLKQKVSGAFEVPL